MDIQRYAPFAGGSMIEDDNGPLIKYADHVVAVQEAELRGAANYEAELVADSWGKGYEQGQQDALVAAVQRVKALPWLPGGYGIRADVIAAINGDSDE